MVQGERERGWDVFISYIERDAPSARLLARSLRACDVRVSFAVDEVEPGGGLASIISAGRVRAPIILLLISKGMEATYDAQEVASAVIRRGESRLIPIHLAPNLPAPRGTASFYHLDLFDEDEAEWVAATIARLLPPRTLPAPTGSILWSPSASGELTERDLSEAHRFADHLGRWVELLADDDPRLKEAEATRDALSRELQLPNPRRGMLRAIVQAALDMLRTEVDALTAGVADLLGEPPVPGRSIVPKAPPIAVPIGEPDPVAEEVWQDVSDHVTDLAAAAVKALPDDEGPPSPPDDEPALPGRGTVLMRWLGMESAASVVRGATWAGAAVAAPWLAAHGPSGVAKVVESLLNLVGI